MKNNPLATVVRSAYIKNVVNKPLQKNEQVYGKNTLSNILRHKRMVRFEQAINRFFVNCGEKPVALLSQYTSERDLLTFSLQLSGYIRDAQGALDGLTDDQAHDVDLIDLYKAAAKYSCECNGQIADSKYIFQEHCNYKFWKIRFADRLAVSKFNNFGFCLNQKRHNLILSMPFHISSDQEELRQWTSKFMGDSLDNRDVFGTQTDVYLAHFPIEQPRGEKFALALETLRCPKDFFNEADMKFVFGNLSKFIGKDIVLNAQDMVIAGQAYSEDEFIETCRNLTIVGYCAGGAHAHRWINAMHHIASQLYDSKTVDRALQNVFVINYAFLPPKGENKYSGVHFMSNYADDMSRKEPFIKMFSPELYEKVKYQSCYFPAHHSVMPDGRNMIVSCDLPENIRVRNAEGEEIPLPNLENGHHMGIITHSQIVSDNDYSRKQFKMVLENASLGKRGHEVFRSNAKEIPSARLVLFPSLYKSRISRRL